MLALVANDGAYSFKLSTVIRVTRTADLSVGIDPKDYEGKDPLPSYLGKATVRLGSGTTAVQYTQLEGPDKLLEG